MTRDETLLRQQHLLVRSTQLRASLAHESHALQKPLALADQLQSGLHWLYHHPQWPLGTMLLLVIIKPRRAVVWGGRLWRAWKGFKRIKIWIAAQN